MSMRAKKQYTIRGIQVGLDRALKKKAEEEGKSLNTVLVESLERAAGFLGEPIVHFDLDGLIGKWEEDPEFERCMEEQERIESDLWK